MSSAANCEALVPMAVINFSFGAAWASFAGFWLVNTWWLNQRHSRPLQKTLFFALVFKALCDLFTGVLFASCPFTSGLAMYWNMAVNTSFTLYSTLVYMSLLLIGKGFCISRNYLQKSEISTLVTVLVIIYLGFSAYMLEPIMMSPLALILVGGICYLTLVYASRTLQRLERQIASFREHNIPQMVVPTTLKWRLMTRFYRLSALFFLLRIVHLLANEVVLRMFDKSPLGWYMWGEIVGGLSEAGLLTSICVLVRSKDQGRYSSLDWIGGPMRIAPLLQATMRKSACRDIPKSNPVLVILSKGRNAGKFAGLEIGFPEDNNVS